MGRSSLVAGCAGTSAPGTQGRLVLMRGALQAAEAAAAQSNREISGYRIESISITDERQRHYQNKQGMGYQGPGQLGEGAYAAGGGGAGAALYNDAGSSGLVAGQQYMMPDGSTAPGVAGHPQMVRRTGRLSVCECVAYKDVALLRHFRFKTASKASASAAEPAVGPSCVYSPLPCLKGNGVTTRRTLISN